jgi:hypothetical protein
MVIAFLNEADEWDAINGGPYNNDYNGEFLYGGNVVLLISVIKERNGEWIKLKNSK